MTEEHILVVDDERHVLDLIRSTLVKEGFRVTCLDSGNKYFESVGSATPDLVLLDVMLPDTDGFKILGQMREKDLLGKLPVIILSAKDATDDVVRGLELGALGQWRSCHDDFRETRKCCAHFWFGRALWSCRSFGG